jgi:hypothetical protein
LADFGHHAAAVVTTSTTSTSGLNITLSGAMRLNEAGTSAMPCPQPTDATCVATLRTSGRHEIGLGGVDAQAAHEELGVVPMREWQLFLACRPGHPLAGSRPTMKQVLGYPLVTVFMHGHRARVAGMGDGSAGAKDLSRKGFAPTIEVNSLVTAKQVARHSDALFPGSASLLRTEFSRGELVRLDFDGPELRIRPALVRMRGRTPSPAAMRFMQLCAQSKRTSSRRRTQSPSLPCSCVSRHAQKRPLNDVKARVAADQVGPRRKRRRMLPDLQRRNHKVPDPTDPICRQALNAPAGTARSPAPCPVRAPPRRSRKPPCR